MIIDARAINIQQASNYLNKQPIPFIPESVAGENRIQEHQKVVMVSIRDSSMPKLFQDAEDVCTVEFRDIEPMNINFQPPEGSEYMTQEHAKKILNFIKKWHDRPEKVLLLAHCMHGMCRSGAVVDFTGVICGLGFWNTRRRNPQIVPNHWVQYQLFKAHFACT